MAGNAIGIDVSNFSGQFDWNATSGLSFGICRASQGLGAAGTNSPDPFLSWPTTSSTRTWTEPNRPATSWPRSARSA
jgi:hypothetical protein